MTIQHLATEVWDSYVIVEVMIEPGKLFYKYKTSNYIEKKFQKYRKKVKNSMKALNFLKKFNINKIKIRRKICY
jgi:hypothetical protein